LIRELKQISNNALEIIMFYSNVNPIYLTFYSKLTLSVDKPKNRRFLSWFTSWLL